MEGVYDMSYELCYLFDIVMYHIVTEPVQEE